MQYRLEVFERQNEDGLLRKREAYLLPFAVNLRSRFLRDVRQENSSIENGPASGTY